MKESRVCKKCGCEGVHNFEETPELIHFGKIACKECGGLIKWVTKPKNHSKRQQSKIKVELDYCEMCLRRKIELPEHETLHIHHKIPICFDGPDEKENTLTLCTSCHALVHWNQKHMKGALTNSDRQLVNHALGLFLETDRGQLFSAQIKSIMQKLQRSTKL